MTQPTSTTTDEHSDNWPEPTFTSRLATLATNPELQQLLTKRFAKHGEFFAAFLAGTDGLFVLREQLTDVYYSSAVTKATTKAGAYAEVLTMIDSNSSSTPSGLDVIHDDVTELFRQYVAALREHVEERFVFVEGTNYWYVFDTYKITPHL